MLQSTQGELFLAARVPAASERSSNEEQKWFAKKMEKCIYKIRAELTKYLDQHKVLLSISYSLLFLCSLSRIALSIYLLARNFYSFAHHDKVVIILECTLSCISLLYYIHRYVHRLQLPSSDSDFDYLMCIFFCVKYFFTSFWTLLILSRQAESEEKIVGVVLLAAYGFLTEKSAGLLLIGIVAILICFFFEFAIRGLMCDCTTLCSCLIYSGYKEIKVPATAYSSTEFAQKECAICLAVYAKSELVCQLPCHPTHIFHYNCLKECLDCAICCYGFCALGGFGLLHLNSV
eukprot:TRINITY_DN13140_c0_g1_i2.p1 TRINITY_DN13140_c0_g1~~TRINITY_DN13140_c0_g1_i2.p1  ORF type:complete len:290 (-),score=46.87 TRINITY_DN13140_c0_g1_i2:204-1073(-)